MISYNPKQTNPDTLCSSKYAPITSFHDYITKKTDGIDSRFAVDFFPYLTICKPTKKYDVAPPILLIGNQSVQLKFFESNAGEGCLKTGRTPIAELEKQSAYGYEYAVENGVFCQECEAIFQFDDRKTYFPFLRYIAKYKEPSGRELIAYLSCPLSLTRQ